MINSTNKDELSEKFYKVIKSNAHDTSNFRGFTNFDYAYNIYRRLDLFEPICTGEEEFGYRLQNKPISELFDKLPPLKKFTLDKFDDLLDHPIKKLLKNFTM